LNEPVQLVLKYDKSKVKNLDNLGIYYYNEAFRKWQYLGGVADKNKGEMSVSLDHFSKYALFEDGTMLQFKDLKGRWSENYVKGLYSLGVLNGIKDGNGYKYEPSRNITRLEFTKLVVETLQNTGRIKKTIGNTELPFADWDNIPDWGREYAASAYTNNIVKGRGTESGHFFDANDPITKAEAATIIGRTLDELGSTVNDFKDKAKHPTWAKEYIGALWNKGIIKGNPDNTFNPNKNLTREEAASMISNWIH
jgi:hypothetical protein